MQTSTTTQTVVTDSTEGNLPRELIEVPNTPLKAMSPATQRRLSKNLGHTTGCISIVSDEVMVSKYAPSTSSKLELNASCVALLYTLRRLDRLTRSAIGVAPLPPPPPSPSSLTAASEAETPAY